MGGISKANIKKTIFYLKRNGIKKTWYAVRERLDERKQPPYIWLPPAEDELKRQRVHWQEEAFAATFSILSPAYRTNEVHLREMIDSLRRQTYPKWELILADATEDDSVGKIVCALEEPRIRYIHLEKNAGIAENTNQALILASGDYIGLLDHDDVLTDDALFEMALQIEQAERQGRGLQLLYSDEDKCNGGRTEYFQPNYKEDFNLDLLLSNNYICHFLVMKRELMQRLKLRPDYEGAQDFDLVLRAASELQNQEDTIWHIPKVLYHWRCHTASTAENPQSKLYAYEAGRRAIQDFADKAGWHAKAVNTPHVGFYTLKYQGSPFDSRKDIGAIGGRIVRKGKTIGGRMTEDGKIFYENLPVQYSGFLHRAILPQDAAAVDIRNIQIRKECREIFQEITGIPYQAIPGKKIFDCSLLPRDYNIKELSLKLCKALRDAGYRILYLPDV